MMFISVYPSKVREMVSISVLAVTSLLKFVGPGEKAMGMFGKDPKVKRPLVLVLLQKYFQSRRTKSMVL